MLRAPDSRALDFCCGTGDLVLALEPSGGAVWGSDFCHPMLVAAREKWRGAASVAVFSNPMR